MFTPRLYLPILFVVSSSLCPAEDWPTWQHDNRRSGATKETLDVGALGLDWTWQSPSPPQTAWAGPAKYDAYAFHRNLPSMRNYDSVFHLIAVGNSIYFGSSSDESLHCLRADDGQQQWVFTTNGPVRLAPTWSDGRVFFGSDDGYARCVDAKDGRLIWEFSPSQSSQRVLNNGRLISFQPCRTGVVVEKDTAWFACAMFPWKDSYLCAVDANTGIKSSPEHFVKKLPGRTMEGAPALSSGALILPQGRVSPRVFDRYTGEDLGDMAKSGGGSVVVVTVDENVLHGPGSDSRKGGFRQSSGQSREMVAALGRGNALVVDGDTSYMLSDDEIIASSLKNQKVQWKVKSECPFAMIKAGDTLFVGGDQKVAAYSANDGKPVWSRAAQGRIFGLAAANGRLYASSDTGVIHCYSTNGQTKDDVAQGESERTIPAGKITTLESMDDDRLVGHWAFQESSTVDNRIHALHGPDLTLAGSGRFLQLGNHQALQLDGAKESAMVTPAFQSVAHPQTAFTTEAWVRIDQLQNWGGIIGIIQDNGSYEKGWLLGYRKDRFCVAVSSEEGPGNLTYLSADQPFELSQWYHVAGSYDGATMRLFVNGRLSAESKQQRGKIAYPPRAWFEIGAYHDQDEYFRMTGAIHEVRLYSHALSPEEITTRFDETKSRIPTAADKIQLASGPWLTFDRPDSATVRWTSSQPQSTRLEFGSSNFERTVSDDTPQTEHQVVLTGLNHNRFYEYRIGETHDGEFRFTEAFECDNFFNFSPPSPNRMAGIAKPSANPLIAHLLAQANAKRGICLVIGDLDAECLVALCRQSELRFVVATTQLDSLEALRSKLRASGVYGNQVAVHHVDGAGDLPFPGNWANIVLLTSKSANQEVIREAQRQTRPDGGVTLIAHNHADLPADFTPLAKEGNVALARFVKPALPGSGDWSHLYGSPDNSAFGGEQLAGAKTSDDLRVQWVGRPGPRYQADRSGRKPSPLAINGRLFLQGLNRIIAVDSFNGTILWSLEIPGFERFNMPRDCSNWCGSSDYLFAAVKDECWKISTETGEVVQRTQAVKEESSPPMDWGYVATEGGRLYGSSVRQGTSWNSFWGGGDAGWYDARSGSVTFPICSDQLFCRDAESMNENWMYQGGLVLNATITVSDDTMYFVESRSARAMAADDRRIGDVDLWKELHLVAIDSYTGKPKWEKKLPPMDPQVVFYLAHAANQLTLVSSSDNSYQVTSLNDQDGAERWTQTTSWPGGKGDHGKAMMRPAIAGDRIFLRPYVLSLKDGTVLPEKVPDGHGCGTYACTADAIIYRANTVTMWSPDGNQKSTWSRLRPDCWLSTIPADGMLLSPEGGGGCSCGSWLETSIGFMPRAHSRE